MILDDADHNIWHFVGGSWDSSRERWFSKGKTRFIQGRIQRAGFAQDSCWMIWQEEGNPYAVPKSMGIFEVLESPLDISTSTIIKRIVANHEAYQASLSSSFFLLSFLLLLHSGQCLSQCLCVWTQKRNLKKEASEKKYYEQKSFVTGD